MNAQTLALVVTAALVALGLLYAVLGWRRRRSARALLHGIAFSVFFVGAWLTDVMVLLADAARGLVSWAREQSLDTRMWAGIICAGLGLLLYVIASFMDGVSRAEGKQRREAAMQKRLGVSGASSPAAGRPEPAASKGPVTDDLDETEITTILQRRGID
ncbi:hypothetical protein [Propionibacterium australiense]|uniref:MetI-like protein n=1 Tax=Propionibacterium australiense TaxID=119981 RepID=A0A383S8Z7_9ACTN|nr:hypothetical protein [Propionibacterium australiense]RLP06491.1 hypothetical protein D9T14_11995 [Propionibacterium australiense]RLP06559.1 hypothetical protein D7U36_12640 [Propionibacterium australiense]SYZ34387.1 MetI-like protein [Propionibacterium australiense]VEH92072.1 Uncharacterised protein [Propionibacterium australiense]